MRRVGSFIALGILFATVAPSTGAQTPVRDRPQPKSGNGSIRGRVLAAVGDFPLRNARVQATSDLGAAAPVFTDGEGRFVIASLSSDRYRLAVAKPGYLPTYFGSQRFGDSGAAIAIAEGTVDSIVVRMVKAAAISGRIVDSLGDPVIAMTVTAAVATNDGRLATTSTVASAQTDDLGAYHLGGLPEGLFLVSVNVVTAVDSRGETAPLQMEVRPADGRPTVISNTALEITDSAAFVCDSQ